MVVIVRSDLKSRITNLTSSTEATGIAHVLGNKGGVATGFLIDKTTSMAFITSHLAARATRLHTRQENCEEIVHGLRLKGNLGVSKATRGMDFLHQFDHVFWFGDLNYRVDMGNHGTENEYKKVVMLAKDEEKRYTLQDYDQLGKEMQSRSVLCDFEEGAIDFAPTYRMVKGENEYSNKKHQNPSYCDRILWKSLPGAAPQMYQTLYTSAPKLICSDHRPILGCFSMMTREPFVCRTPIVTEGAGKHGRFMAHDDMVIISLSSLEFKVSDETSHPKAKRSVR